jgi:flagellar FliL protein
MQDGRQTLVHGSTSLRARTFGVAKKKRAEEGSDEAGSEGKGGGGKMMPAAMISIALIAAGYFVGGRSGSAAPAAEPAVSLVEAAEPEVETIIGLEPVNVNLADGHYLRVAISIGLTAEAHSEDATAEATAETAPATTAPRAPAADLVLSTFAGKTIEELSTLEGRVAARDHLQEGLKEFYGEQVLTVFFTEFVMQ